MNVIDTFFDDCGDAIVVSGPHILGTLLIENKGGSGMEVSDMIELDRKGAMRLVSAIFAVFPQELSL